MTSSRSHSTALTFHKGKESSISHLENEVLDWFHEQTAHGLVVSVNMLLIHLCQIDGEFCHRTKPSHVQAIHHLLKRNQIVYRAVTHESLKSPEDTSGIASDYIVSMIPRMLGIVRDQ